MIKDLKSLKRFLKEKVNFPVFGAGVYAFHRLGPEDFLPNYKILTLRQSLDGQLIKKDLEVISIEKTLGIKHIREPRNATTVIKHPKIKKYLQKFKSTKNGVNILVYKPSSKMEKICQENKWNLIAPPVKFGKNFFENKIKFRQILEELNIPVLPGKITTLEKLHYGHLINSYGLPFVIQHPTKGGGKGTFFINNKDDFDKVYKKLKEPTRETYLGEKKEEPATEILITKFIEGPSPSVTGCVTKQGVLSTNPQYQVLDMPELYNPEKGSGLFCGHDWTSSNFSKDIKRQIYEITEKIGDYFKEQGYKGIFGLDFILDEKTNKFYVTESNPRLLGSFPTISMIQMRNNEPPILAFHILEYLKINYEMNLKAINTLMRKNKQGAQMILHNLSGKWAKIGKTIKPGIYQLNKNGKIKFLRPGYKIQHLKKKSEFLITEGVLIKKSHISPNRRLCRILTLNKVLENYKKLTPWAKTVAEEIYKEFRLKPIKFIRLKKIFRPNFLAKG